MFHMTRDALSWRTEPSVYHSSGVDDIMAIISHKLSSIYQIRQIDGDERDSHFVVEPKSERNELIIKSL